MKDMFVDIEKLEKCSALSEKINRQAKLIEESISKAPLGAMDEVRPFIQPKKNIEKILTFYKTYQLSTAKINSKKLILQEAFGENFKSRKLELLIQNNVIGHMKDIQSEIAVIEGYKGIKIVDEFLKDIKAFTFMVIEAISRSFFKALQNIPDYDPNMRMFADFLIPQQDVGFLTKYTNIVYSKLGFSDIGTNYKMLINRTLELSKYFRSIFEMNNDILGHTQANTINEGMVKMFIINIKSIISNILMIFEKDEDPETIAYMILISKNLRHSDGIEMTKEIEELFVFKKEINKIISNCLISYFEELDDLEKPNKKLHAEKLTVTMRSILSSFNDYKDVANLYVVTYGPFFGIRSLEEMNTSFSTRALDKILLIGDKLSGMERSVYLINNFDPMKTFLVKYEDTALTEIIEAKLDSIVDIWVDELKRAKNVDEFITQRLEKCKKYSLPEDVRSFLIPKLKSAVSDFLIGEGHSKASEAFLSEVSDLFTGKD